MDLWNNYDECVVKAEDFLLQANGHCPAKIYSFQFYFLDLAGIIAFLGVYIYFAFDLYVHLQVEGCVSIMR